VVKLSPRLQQAARFNSPDNKQSVFVATERNLRVLSCFFVITNSCRLVVVSLSATFPAKAHSGLMMKTYGKNLDIIPQIYKFLP
jgi:hypothetical protein